MEGFKEKMITGVNPCDAEFYFFVLGTISQKFVENYLKPSHVGIHWKALTEFYQMNTQMSGYHLFFNFISFFLSKSATSSTRG